MSDGKAKSKAKVASRTTKPRKPAAGTKTNSRTSSERVQSSGDWRASMLAEMRRLIHEADLEIVEERKWKKPSNPSGVPVWSHAGIVCTGETYKQLVKLTFMRGASLEDPHGLFNSSLEGNARRAIDIREGESIDADALKALIRAAVAENLGSGSSTSKSASKAGAKARTVKLLSGGNPQIAKADGDAPVQAYIAAMPGWKSDLGKRLDALITRTVPHVRKAVKWNSPFYGSEDQGWFLSFHVLTRYVKVTFFNGLSLRPIPPGGTPKCKESRWIDIYEEDGLNEAQMATWMKQAAALPGWKM